MLISLFHPYRRRWMKELHDLSIDLNEQRTLTLNLVRLKDWESLDPLQASTSNPDFYPRRLPFDFASCIVLLAQTYITIMGRRLDRCMFVPPRRIRILANRSVF
jgi:hypothetical protein